MPPAANALAQETSPYLLQHADNPVDWLPWGAAALARAQREDKLLLISIGYAACHWCHVMAHESFEDHAVAAVMNAHFVCIKVDREERPDVDDVYTQACQLSGGGGCGWPLNAVALPDGRPVWAGTYFPKPRWIEVLNMFVRLQLEEPEKLAAYARQLHEQLQPQAPLVDAAQQPASWSRTTTDAAAAAIVAVSDTRWGGFGGAPKFPLPVGYEFLLDYIALEAGDEDAYDQVVTVVERGLLAMAQGGIYDQLGGGFARYAVDARWHVPHFEKMLYDNAQLLAVYSRALRLVSPEHAHQQRTVLAEYKAVVTETVAFLERELRAPAGFFYSSLDADSEGVEGKFYVWTWTELAEHLSDQQLELVQQVYDVRPDGNWEHGLNVLHRPKGWEAMEAPDGVTAANLKQVLAQARTALFTAREARIRPALDDKVLVSWNGLLLTGLVEAFLSIGDSHYLQLAQQCADALRATFLQPDGSLLRTYAKGRTHIRAFLDDYANFAQGLLDLYQSTFEESQLRLAQQLAEHALQHFGDDTRALLYYTSDEDAGLVARRLEDHDNVMPASNSVIAGVLFELGQLLDEQRYLARAEAMLEEMQPMLAQARQSLYHARWLRLHLRLTQPQYVVALVGPEALTQRYAFAKHVLPQLSFVGSLAESNLPTLAGKFVDQQTWIYVCQHGLCQRPVQQVEEALAQLEE